MRYLDGVALAKLRNLHLDLRRHRVSAHLGGRHQSSQYGFSQEFAQHREYVPGDELRYLDWKVYARKDRYFIKQFQEDKSLATYLVVDSSGSMGYRALGGASKWEYGCTLAMAVGYLTLAQGDAAGLVTFPTERCDFLPPRRQLTHLELMDSCLGQIRPQGETDLAQTLRQVSGLLPRRSAIVLISDLWGDPQPILDTVRALRARKHEVLILQVLDPMERELSLEGPVRFVSLENQEVLRCEVDLVRQVYQQALEDQFRFYQAGFHGAGVPYATVYTDAPWDRSLCQFLAFLNRLS